MRDSLLNLPVATIAVVYLARGADTGCFNSFERFLNSYKSRIADIHHTLYIVFKGFKSETDLSKARNIFDCVDHKRIYLDDNSFDIGAYIQVSAIAEEQFICMLNTGSEIMTNEWLTKLFSNLCLPGIGLVGATGSFESLRNINFTFPSFPNIHIRTSGFLIERTLFVKLTKGLKFSDKWDCYQFESGVNSLTNRVTLLGLKILVVGRNGRGYSPEFWPDSDSFRLAGQDNLLIHDNQTRGFSTMPWGVKREFVSRTWGKFLE